MMQKKVFFCASALLFLSIFSPTRGDEGQIQAIAKAITSSDSYGPAVEATAAAIQEVGEGLSASHILAIYEQHPSRIAILGEALQKGSSKKTAAALWEELVMGKSKAEDRLVFARLRSQIALVCNNGKICALVQRPTEDLIQLETNVVLSASFAGSKNEEVSALAVGWSQQLRKRKNSSYASISSVLGELNRLLITCNTEECWVELKANLEAWPEPVAVNAVLALMKKQPSKRANAVAQSCAMSKTMPPHVIIRAVEIMLHCERKGIVAAGEARKLVQKRIEDGTLDRSTQKALRKAFTKKQ